MIKTTRPLIGLMLALGLPTVGFAEDIPTPSQIQAVTIYPDSARVMRSATVTLPSGTHRLLLSGLPTQLDTDSLRVSGVGAANALLGSVQLSEQVAANVIQQQERKLQEELENWRIKRQEAVDAKARAEQQLAFIRATGLQQPTKDSSSPSQQLAPEQWQQAWSILESATAEAQAKVRTADQTVQAFDKTITQLQQQLEQVATGATTSRTASLQVTVTQPGELTLNLFYQIHNASWSPVYEAELDSASGKLSLKTQAEIQQLTGEDWSQSKATLSTLRPNSQTTLPEQDSWIISLYDPSTVPQISARGAYAPAPVASADYAAEALMAAPAPAVQARQRPQVMQVQTSTLLNSSYTADYQVPGELSLASGSDARRVTLDVQSFDTTLGLASYPRFDPRAILTTESIYTGQAPLLPGRVALYRDGSFIGSSELAELKTGEPLKLSFGEDDRVKIEFRPAPGKTSEPGLLSNRKRLDQAYTVTVSNQHEQGRSITLYDVIPVADTSEISVTSSGETPSLKDVDGKKGVLGWIRQLPAQGSSKLDYGYTVSYPQDKELSGL